MGMVQVARTAGPLAVSVAGEGGVAILFVHGNGGDHTHWAAQQAHFRTRTVALDLNGMGGSAPCPLGRYGVDACADDVLAVADALSLSRFLLVGHSFGGAVAAGVAARQPERLAGAVYVEAPGDLRSVSRLELDAWLGQFRPDAYEQFRERWVEPMLVHARPDTRDTVLRTLRATPREVVVGNLESLTRFDPSAGLRAAPDCTYTVVGEGALLNPVSLAVQRPDLPARVLPRVSHWLMMDAPDAFNAELEALLARCSSPMRPPPAPPRPSP